MKCKSITSKTLFILFEMSINPLKTRTEDVLSNIYRTLMIINKSLQFFLLIFTSANDKEKDASTPLTPMELENAFDNISK